MTEASDIGGVEKFAPKGFFLSHRGKVREANEDSILCDKIYSKDDCSESLAFDFSDKNQWIIALADGMGGAAAGEVASRKTVQTLQTCRDYTSTGIAEALCRINQELYQAVADDEKLRGMGSTVSGICHGPDGYVAFNVGDSRIYRQQDQFLSQISKDDTAEQILIDAGKSDPGRIRGKGLNQLTQALGGGGEYRDIEPNIFPITIKRQSRLLLCSDGLTDMVDLDALEAIMSQEKDNNIAINKLFDAAMQKGGRDNISIIILELCA